MPDKDPATAAAEAAAKELVKVAYGDLLQPAARVVGTELGEFVQAIVVAGRGFGYLIRETYQPFVLRALQRVPLDQRVLPRPEVLGPILEGVTYQPSGSELMRMFEALLASAMDRSKPGLDHPAFTYILRQISPQQAEIIEYANQYGEVLAVRFAYGSEGDPMQIVRSIHNWSLDISRPELEFSHLVELGVLSVPRASGPWENENFEGRSHTELSYRLSVVGRALAMACLPHP